METVPSMIDAIIQLILFSLIPLLWWLFKGRKQTNLLEYLGLKKPSIKNTRGFIGVLIIDFVIILIQLFGVPPLFIDEADMSTSAFTNRGLSVLFPVLIYAFVQTGLAEEIFFRGFLAKRLIHQFGLNIGNIIQAFLFGLIHGLIFFNYTSTFGVIVIIFLTGFNGWLMGLLNEKYSNGSIIPSWLVHALSNLISSVFSMFGLM